MSKSNAGLFKISFRSSEDSDFNEELAEFYFKFVRVRPIQRVNIVHYDILDEGFQKKYTSYTIKVKTSHIEYTIQKRYSEFRTLFNKIEKKYKDLKGLVSNFPEKKIFGSLDQEVIDQRKKMLNEFLSTMSVKYEEHICIEFLEFLELKDRYINAHINIDDFVVETSIQSKAITMEEKEIAALMDKLNTEPDNYIAHFRAINNFFIDSKPMLNPEFIKSFLFGENKMKGLVHVCGKRNDQDDSHLICTTGLNLVCDLLDFEINKDAEIYSYHINKNNQKACTKYALRILDTYISRNPSLNEETLKLIVALFWILLYIKQIPDSLKKVGDDQYVLKELKRWKNSNKFSSVKTEQYDFLDEEKKKNDEPLPNTNKRMTIDLSSDDKSLREFLNDKARKWDPVNSKDEHIKLKQHKGIYMKMTVYLSVTAEEAYNLLLEKRSFWDSLLEEYKVLEEIDSKTWIIYEKLLWNTSFNRRHILFFSEKKIDIVSDKEFYISKRSVEPKEPVVLKKDECVGQWLFCMRIKECLNQKTHNLPEDKEACKITIVCKNFNLNTQFFMSSDLLGESTTLIDNLRLLKKYCV